MLIIDDHLTLEQSILFPQKYTEQLLVPWNMGG
jgi:hypothetical protein